MAQSRPHASRSQTTPSSSHYTTTSNSRASSPNPLSPRSHNRHHDSERRHHTRRKSGKSSDHVVTTSDKKTSSSRPSLTRKQTPQHSTKSNSERRSHREERDRDEERRDSGECFAQFWYVQAFLFHTTTSRTCGGDTADDEGKLGKGLSFFGLSYMQLGIRSWGYQKYGKTCMKWLSNRGVEASLLLIGCQLT